MKLLSIGYQKKSKFVKLLNKSVKLSFTLLGISISMAFLTKYGNPSFERLNQIMLFQLLFLTMAIVSLALYYTNLRDLIHIESLVQSETQNDVLTASKYKKNSFLFHSACYLTMAMIFQWLDRSANINLFSMISDIFGSLFVVSFGYFLWYTFKKN